MVIGRKTRCRHVRKNQWPDTERKRTSAASLPQGGGKGRGASSVDGRGGRGKTRINREAEQAFWALGTAKDRTRLERNPAGSPQWPEGGSGLSLPQFLVHRPGPRRQSARAGLGKDAHWHSTRNFPTLVRLPEAARLSHQLPGRRFSGRHARRYLHHHCMG